MKRLISAICVLFFLLPLSAQETTSNHQLSQAGLTIGNERIVR